MTDLDTRSNGSGGTYTHRGWKHETGQVLLVDAAIVQALDQMLAALAEVEAGKTHMDLMRQLMVEGGEILEQGLTLVDETDRRYLPVHEAVQAAGGKEEVATVKTYHQT
jgi:hypothetical protein